VPHDDELPEQAIELRGVRLDLQSHTCVIGDDKELSEPATARQICSDIDFAADVPDGHAFAQAGHGRQRVDGSQDVLHQGRR
jgi:hypothetical protein